MVTLIEQLRQANAPQPKQPSLVSQLQGQQTQLQQAARATQAGAGGLGFTGAGRGSRQAERFALQEVAGQEQQLKQAEQMQAAQVDQAQRQQEQQFQFQAQDQEERVLNARMEWSNQAAQVIGQFSKESFKLEQARTKSAVEFSASLMRLANEDYVERLRMEGQRSRLDDELSFKEAMTKSVFEEELDMFIGDLNFRSIVMADARAHREALAAVDINFALQMANSSAAAAAATQQWQAIGTGISATSDVIKAYAANQASQPKADEG
jgi:hypothetical protein